MTAFERYKHIFSKKNIKWLLLAFVLSVIVYLFFPIFHVKNIIILGNSGIKETDLVKYTDQNLDKNIYLLNRKKIEQDFLSNPYIKNVDTIIKFPWTLTISVTERKAVATLKFAGGFAIIDEDGIVLETTQDVNKIVKPMVSGITPKNIAVGQKVETDNNLVLGLEIISNVKSAKLLKNISLVDITNIRDIKLTTPHGINVMIGDGEKDLNKKMLTLNKILINLFERKIYTGYVDMRYDSYPVYRSKK